MRFYSLPYANDIAFPSMHKCTSKTYTVDDNRAHLDTYTMLYIFGDEEARYRNLNGLSVWFVIIRKNRSSSGPCVGSELQGILLGTYSNISLSWKFPG